MTSLAPKRTLRRAATGLVVGLVSALALTGCVKVDMSLTVSPDDTVTSSMLLAISDDAAAALGVTPDQLFGAADDELADDLPDGATQERFEEDGWTGTRISTPATPIGEATGVAGEDLTITRDGDEFVLDGSLDLSGLADTGDVDPELLDEMSLNVEVTFPGPVIETNGTVDGNTVRWTPVPGEANEMHARASAIDDGTSPAGSAVADSGESDGGVNPLLIGGIVVVVLAAIAAGVVVARKKRATAESVGAVDPFTTTSEPRTDV